VNHEIENHIDVGAAFFEGREPVVSGEDGLRALETAIRITDLLAPKGLAPTGLRSTGG